MKQNHIFITGIILLLFLACACTDEQEEVSGGGGKEQGQKVTLTLTSLPLQGSGTVTRSEGKGMDLVLGSEADTETRAVENENRVSNLCVFQFEGDLGSSSAVLIGKTYASGLTSTTFPLILEPFTTHCFLYVCANVGDITGDYTVKTSTYQDILDASLRVDKQEDFGTALPMSGCSELIGESAISGNIGITLTRMVAKVTFTCTLDIPSGDKFEITGARLCNVPQTADYVFSDGNADAVGVNSHIGTNASSAQQNTATYVWYMPESKRGTKQGANSWADRIEKNAPNYASFIELTGNYTHSLGDGETTTEVTYAIYLGNGKDYTNYDVECNHHYQITSTIKGINTADRRVTTDTNLSADGLANCYLAGKDNHWYRFNGTVRGNGNSVDYAQEMYGLTMLPADGVNITGISDAVVIWETAEGLINSVKWDESSQCVKFQTGTAKGNALIAVRNATGEVLWSWHIWRTDGVDLATLNAEYTLDIETNTNRSFYTSLPGVGAAAGKVRPLTILDRNIGANFSSGSGITLEDNRGAYCLQYQFGRKDPFPAGTVANTQGPGYICNGDVNLYGYASGKKTLFTILSKRGYAAGVGNDAATTLDYVRKNPEVFLYANDPDLGNWINSATVSTDNWKISNCLWGDENRISNVVDPDPWDGEKTIYDPSPAGWRVAPADTWTGVAITSANGWVSSIYGTLAGSEGWWVYFNNKTEVQTFLPISGHRHRSGNLISYGWNSENWLSSPAGQGEKGAAAMVFSKTGALNLAIGPDRCNGYPVRCARYYVGKK